MYDFNSTTCCMYTGKYQAKRKGNYQNGDIRTDIFKGKATEPGIEGQSGKKDANPVTDNICDIYT